MSVAISLHLLAAVIWVGGMFFALLALRPAAAEALPSEHGPRLWAETLRRFLAWVWGAVIVLPVTGYWIVYGYWGGLQHAGFHVHLMQGLGWFMILLFLHLYFEPFRRLQRAVADNDTEVAVRQLGQIRIIVMVNLALGLAVTVIASAGRVL